MYGSDGDSYSHPNAWQSEILKAASYAACSQDHPLYRLQSVKKGINAYCLAFLDALDGPQLIAVDSKRWTGAVGEPIHFHVRENIRVMHVRVMIFENQTSDTTLESGHAYQSRLDPSIWTYITKTRILQNPGLCMGVLSNDLAGNSSADTVIFDYD